MQAVIYATSLLVLVALGQWTAVAVLVSAQVFWMGVVAVAAMHDYSVSKEEGLHVTRH